MKNKKAKNSDPSRALYEQDVEKGLAAIYRDEKGKVPDLSSFERARSRWWLYAFGAVSVCAIVLIALAWFGMAFSKPFRGFSGQGLSLQVEGPERIELGQETTYFINYQNVTSDPLASSEIRVSFPSDFVVMSTEPRPADKDLSWRLGTVDRDGRGTIKIRGVFTGALGTQTAIQVVGLYRPATFNSDFETVATKVLNYADSVLHGKLFVPEKVLPGDRVQITYSVKNVGDRSFDALVTKIVLPTGFQPNVSSTAALDGQVLSQPIGTLAAGSSTTIFVTGVFASGVGGEAHVTAETGRVGVDGTWLASDRQETSFSVLAGDLSLKLILNGKAESQAVTYGTPLHFTLGYENTASEDLRDVTMRLRFEAVTSTTKRSPPLVRWETLEDELKGMRKDSVLTWTKEQIPAFGRLPPYEDGSLEVSMSALQSASGTPGLAVRAILEAEIGSVGTTTLARVIRSTPLVFAYVTDAELRSEARYYSEEGAPLGSGPLPPVVGQATTYRIRWVLTKRFHELKDIRVKAVLPPRIQWVDRQMVDAGSVKFDAVTRTIQWDLNRLPADIGEATAEFDIQLIPAVTDANRFAKLMGETRFEATDATAGQAINLTSEALTTDLQNDAGAQGKGVVRKE